MIRINILRNRGGVSNLKTSVNNMTGITFIGGGETQSSKSDSRDLIKKFVIFLIAPLLLIAYDQMAKMQMSNELQRLQQEKVALDRKKAEFGPKAESVKKFQEEKAKLVKRIDIIKNISKERLKIVKALDNLHRTVPQQAWISELSVKDNYLTKIQGFALDDFVVSNLIKNLDESIFFTDVRLVSSQETTDREGRLRKYEISGRLGEY